MIEAVPEPKWKSSVPVNEPMAIVVGTNGVAVESMVGDGPPASEACAVAVASADDIGGAVDGTTVGVASTSEVRTTSGDAMYQPTGTAIARRAPASAADRPGWRRAAPSQPARQATTARIATAMTDPI